MPRPLRPVGLEPVVAAQPNVGITLRAIAETFGKSHVYHHHYAHAIDDRLVAVEVRALDTLTPVFSEVSHGASIA